MAAYDYNTRMAITRMLEAEQKARIGKSGVSGDDLKLAEEICKQAWSGEQIRKISSEFYRDPAKKPSQWMKQKSGLFGKRIHQPLMDAFVPKAYQESFLYIIDKLNQFPFTRGWNRRTVRTAGYGGQIEQVFQIMAAYEKLFYTGDKLEDYILGNLSEEKLDYIRNDWRAGFGRYFNYLYAAEIDRGNQAVIHALKDLIYSENNTAYLDRNMIWGILCSDNEDLQQDICQLLLAARLQEGLRQCICEVMDEGTPKAFRSLLDVIEKNDLIRYSSVKRAVSTWIGIFDEKNVDRVNQKLLTFMGKCLRDKSFCEEQLKTNDAVAINAALWALGFTEAEDAIGAMEHLIVSGTKAQKLAASYYNENLYLESLKERLGRRVVLEQTENLDHAKDPELTENLELTAAYFPAYTARVSAYIQQLLGGKSPSLRKEVEVPIPAVVTDYFENRTDAERQYRKMKALLAVLPKKGVVYDPCIFPWYRVSLDRSPVIRMMAFIAYVLQDEEKITEIAGLLGEVDSWHDRQILINLLLYRPQNQAQRDALLRYMGNAETYTSKKAVAMVKTMELGVEDYRVMEDMLRFKRSGLRGELIGFLMKQKDGTMEACLTRLLADKLEEKRSAGLDMILRLSKDETRRGLYQKVRPLVKTIGQPTDKEKILIEEISGENEENAADQKGFGIYDLDAPDKVLADNPWNNVLQAETDARAKREWQQAILPMTEKEVIEKIQKLDRLVKQYKDFEYENSAGEKELLGNCYTALKKDGKHVAGTWRLDLYPLAEVFREFYEKELGSYRNFIEFEAWLLLSNEEIYENGGVFYQAVFGKKPFKPLSAELEYGKQVRDIRLNYRWEFLDRKQLFEDSVCAIRAITEVINDKNVVINYHYKGWNNNVYTSKVSAANLPFLSRYFDGLRYWETDEEFVRAFDAAWKLEQKCQNHQEQGRFMAKDGRFGTGSGDSLTPLCPYWFLKAYHMGLISRDIMYKAVMEYFYRARSLEAITQIVKGEMGKAMNFRTWNLFFGNQIAQRMKEHGDEIVGENTWCGKLIRELYDSIVPVMVDVELRRGEAETPFSPYMSGITFIRGTGYLVRILMALGKDTLGREAYYSWYYSASNTKRDVLSRLLKNCYPEEGACGETLKAALSGTSIKKERLVEVAMYAPQWIDVIEEYLGWAGLKCGCYYFMAHMNERFDDQKKAMIAKYTPLTAEELQEGAFDSDWFEEAYGILGEKNFNVLYQAAKYISDGQKHSRARKYADAASGKAALPELAAEIKAKRNKDLLMSYGLVPFGEDREKNMLDRYQFIKQYQKESRQFGAQRRASEGRAAEIALVNLSVRAGFSDVTRLTLRMETKLTEEFAPYMEWRPVEDVEVALSVDEQGKSEILCRKDGKTLKSVPSRLGKKPYVAELKEAHKKLKDQYARTRKMMEEAMESGSCFEAEELAGLWENPVTRGILAPLVFVCGDDMGFLRASETDGGEEWNSARRRQLNLEAWNGSIAPIPADSRLSIAHPLHLYRAGTWHEYQKYLFDHEIRQPFKQVFRELYVKLEEEKNQTSSRMFAGNQIQPQKTVGCLKSRRWVADYEEGLQKIYYKENIIARIYALADWFSPSDIEAPTLEWVEFSDRKTFAALTIDQVPDLIYSEVMRDVDLAVSVAHAGGVDPETSHSTIEMRRAIVEFNLPLFGLKNVTLTDSHALIRGTRAVYNVHLGSGVVHQEGGAMLNILPVHSQKRGKLFLPFVDEDPKTAEIMSKIVLLAEDKKLKDPFILDQIR